MPNLDTKRSDSKVHTKFQFSQYAQFSRLTGCYKTKNIFVMCLSFCGEKEWSNSFYMEQWPTKRS